MRRRDFLKCLAGSGAALSLREVAYGQERAQKAGSLAGHKIAKFETRMLRDRYPRPVGRNAHGGPAGRGGRYKIRVVTTSEGATGWGMCYPDQAKLEPFVGHPLDELFDVDQGTLVKDAPYLDIVLHDLAARILGVPVWKMIGARGPRRLPIYSGAIYFEDLEERRTPVGIAAVIAACNQDYDAGYRAFKLKVGRGKRWMERAPGLKRDIAVVRRVREAFPDCRVLVDANNGWPVTDACTFVAETADCDLFFIEEPFHENHDGLRILKDAMTKHGSKALIAEGESRKDRSSKWWRFGGYSRKHIDRLLALAEEKLVDVFVTDLGITGFSNWRRTMPELQKAGVTAAPHTWAWTPRTFYSAQLLAGVGNACIVEGIPGKAKGIDYSAYTIEEGKLRVPASPGLGLGLSG